MDNVKIKISHHPRGVHRTTKSHLVPKGRRCPYLGPLAMNKKTKETLLSQTLNVEEKKVSLFFRIMAKDPRYGHFLFLSQEVEDIPSSRRENSDI